MTLIGSLARATQHPNIFGKLIGRKPLFIALEIVCLGQEIRFIVVGPQELRTFLESQIFAAYPLATVEPLKDYLDEGSWPDSNFYFKTMKLTSPSFYPLKTYLDFQDIDPLTALLGVLSKATPTDSFCMQIVLCPPASGYQKAAIKALAPIATPDGPKPNADPAKKIIEQKIGSAGAGVSIRLVSNNSNLLSEMAQSLYIMNRPDGNSLKLRNPFPWDRKSLRTAIRHRRFKGSKNHVLNIQELATLWHLPGEAVKIANIAWTEKAFSEAPDNLPIVPPDGTPNAEEAQHDVNFLAKTIFKNKDTVFGIKREDRMRHMYIIGKSGSGKSTLLENMAVDDFKKDAGVAFIDPHGDGVESLLNYIPSHRINQTIYFNPADREFPVALNMLEVKDPSQAELVASGIVAIFHKLYGNSWGPRLEYILRNTILTLTYLPGSTLVDVPTILTDRKFRNAALEHVSDEVLLRFWNDEFNRMTDKLLAESISPILNKVGQFVTSPLIRSVIGHQKSSIDLETAMNDGYILLCNLSQGKLGEDNAALLGAMIITKLELAAMNRVHVARSERRDFFLYVDEFQNFATTSFIKILAEARKYRLGLIMANQYIAQIPEEIQQAIFGNAGSIVSFVLGADDSEIMEREYGEIFTKTDLVALRKYQIATRLTIDAEISRPFLGTTLPPLKSTYSNREAVIAASRERFATTAPQASLTFPSIALAETPSADGSPNPDATSTDHESPDIRQPISESPIVLKIARTEPPPPPKPKLEFDDYFYTFVADTFLKEIGLKRPPEFQDRKPVPSTPPLSSVTPPSPATPTPVPHSPTTHQPSSSPSRTHFRPQQRRPSH